MNTKQKPNKFQSPISGNGKKNTKKKGSSEMLDVIRKAGSPTPSATNQQPDVKRDFNIEIWESELKRIQALCDAVPAQPGRKVGLTKRRWIRQAIEEKLARDEKAVKPG